MRVAAVARVFAVLILLAFGVQGAGANAVLIDSRTFSFSSGGRGAFDFRPQFSFGMGFTGPTGSLAFIREHLLFDGIYSAGDVGRTFVVDASDPDFSFSAAELTNGVNGRSYVLPLPVYHDPALNRLVVGGGEPSGGSIPESLLFYGSFNPVNGRSDLKGHRISEIHMHVDSVRMTIGPHTVAGTTHPNGAVDFGATMTLSFYGEPDPATNPVPLPGAASAGGVALGVIALRRWVRRRAI